MAAVIWPRSRRPRSIHAGAALLPLLLALVAVDARAHHPGDDFGMVSLVMDGEVSFHFRDARVDAVGSVRPAVPSPREASRAKFALVVQGVPYLGPVKAAFIDASGQRFEGVVEQTGGMYLARFEAGGAGTGHLRIELLRARGAAFLVPVTVVERWPWFAIVAAAGSVLLVVLLVRHLRRFGHSAH